MFKRMVRVGLVIIPLATTLLVPHRVGACSCIISSFVDQFQDAHTVFLGTLTTIQDDPAPDPEVDWITQPIIYTFRVHRVFKGAQVTIRNVHSVEDTSACGAGLKQGETYVVYAFWRGTHLGTSGCNPNHPASSLQRYVWQLEYSIDALRQRIGFISRLRWN
jgi:hypothetical protein